MHSAQKCYVFDWSMAYLFIRTCWTANVVSQHDHLGIEVQVEAIKHLAAPAIVANAACVLINLEFNHIAKQKCKTLFPVPMSCTQVSYLHIYVYIFTYMYMYKDKKLLETVTLLEAIVQVHLQFSEMLCKHSMSGFQCGLGLFHLVQKPQEQVAYIYICFNWNSQNMDECKPKFYFLFCKGCLSFSSDRVLRN